MTTIDVLLIDVTLHEKEMKERKHNYMNNCILTKLTDARVNCHVFFCKWSCGLSYIYDYLPLLPILYFLHLQQAPQQVLVLFLDE